MFEQYMAFTLVPFSFFLLWIVSEIYGGRALRIVLGSVLFINCLTYCYFIEYATYINTQVDCWVASERFLDSIRKISQMTIVNLTLNN